MIVDDEELNDRIVTNCGYPGNKPPGTMWITGGKISSYTANRISYMNDTMGGQSRSPVVEEAPVFEWYKLTQMTSFISLRLDDAIV